MEPAVTSAGKISPAAAPLTIGVIICCYTDRRWEVLSQSIDSVLAQLEADDELVIVVDHAPELKIMLETARPQATIVENAGPQGLSGARNTGLQRTGTDVVLFLDDDAVATSGWLKAYRAAFATNPRLALAGGAVTPWWEGDAKPAWFPDEFGWVVGCDYRGLPGDNAAIRNPIGANMAIRRPVAMAVGGFSSHLGRVGAVPVGDEETELGIKVRQLTPGSEIVRLTAARVEHLVPRDRQTFSYFRRRCFHEGRSKAVLSATVGQQDALSSERSYLRTLATGVAREVRHALRGDVSALLRAGVIPAGLGFTAVGFLVMTARLRTGSAAVLLPQQR